MTKTGGGGERLIKDLKRNANSQSRGTRPAIHPKRYASHKEAPNEEEEQRVFVLIVGGFRV